MSWTRNGWMKFMWPTWPTVGLSAASPVRMRAAALAPREPREPESLVVVREELLDAHLP